MLCYQKRCLVKPAEAPLDWPQGWEFPNLWVYPPGWPKAMPEGVTLAAAYSQGVLKAHCLDEFGEPTDALKKQFISVCADKEGKAVRLRQADAAPWSKMALFQIDALEDGFGIKESLQFERDCHVSVEVFGYDGSEVVL